MYFNKVQKSTTKNWSTMNVGGKVCYCLRCRNFGELLMVLELLKGVRLLINKVFCTENEKFILTKRQSRKASADLKGIHRRMEEL